MKKKPQRIRKRVAKVRFDHRFSPFSFTRHVMSSLQIFTFPCSIPLQRVSKHKSWASAYFPHGEREGQGDQDQAHQVAVRPPPSLQPSPSSLHQAPLGILLVRHRVKEIHVHVTDKQGVKFLENG